MLLLMLPLLLILAAIIIFIVVIGKGARARSAGAFLLGAVLGLFLVMLLVPRGPSQLELAQAQMRMIGGAILGGILLALWENFTRKTKSEALAAHTESVVPNVITAPLISEPTSRFCVKCGRPLREDAMFCGVCGAPKT